MISCSSLLLQHSIAARGILARQVPSAIGFLAIMPILAHEPRLVSDTCSRIEVILAWDILSYERLATCLLIRIPTSLHQLTNLWISLSSLLKSFILFGLDISLDGLLYLHFLLCDVIILTCCALSRTKYCALFRLLVRTIQNKYTRDWTHKDGSA